MGKNHYWSASSAEKLATCDTRLQDLMREALLHFPHDMTIIEGHRTNERQAQLLAEGKSKLGPGQSKHNAMPSRAVDAAPIVDGKIDWKNRELWIAWASFIKGLAAARGIPIRWGGDWDGDFDSAEHGFWDGPHFELAE